MALSRINTTLFTMQFRKKCFNPKRERGRETQREWETKTMYVGLDECEYVCNGSHGCLWPGWGGAEPHQARCLGAQLSAGSLGSHGVHGSLAPCALGVAIPCVKLL